MYPAIRNLIKRVQNGALACGKADEFLTPDERAALRVQRVERKERAEARQLEQDSVQVMLYALKNGLDPDGPEAQAEIEGLRAAYNKKCKKPRPRLFAVPSYPAEKTGQAE